MATARLTAATLAGVALASSLTACNGDESAPDGSYIYDGEAGTVTARATGAGGNTTMLSGPAIASPLPVDISMMPDAEVTRATHVTAEDGLHIADNRTTDRAGGAILPRRRCKGRSVFRTRSGRE